MDPKEIVFVSGHHPRSTYYARRTRMSFDVYCRKHGYRFYYDDEPEDKINGALHILHYRRCAIIPRAQAKYPDSTWFVWVDSDVYVNNYDMRVEEQIDLTDGCVLYHLFHERDWGCYPINTGVKFVHRDAIGYEVEMWKNRDTPPWNTFPFEQKALYEYVLTRPELNGRYIIHDPYILNCIILAYPDRVPLCLFAHMCAMGASERDKIMKMINIDR